MEKLENFSSSHSHRCDLSFVCEFWLKYSAAVSSGGDGWAHRTLKGKQQFEIRQKNHTIAPIVNTVLMEEMIFAFVYILPPHFFDFPSLFTPLPLPPLPHHALHSRLLFNQQEKIRENEETFFFGIKRAKIFYWCVVRSFTFIFSIFRLSFAFLAFDFLFSDFFYSHEQLLMDLSTSPLHTILISHPPHNILPPSIEVEVEFSEL